MSKLSQTEDFFEQQTATGKQTSHEAEARSPPNVRNEAQCQPVPNLRLAPAYPTASDPAFVELTPPAIWNNLPSEAFWICSGIVAGIFQNHGMTTQTRRLPLYVALAALLLYACTMGGGLTLSGLPLASKLAGWDDAPMVGQPLLWLLTLPLRVLPAAWVPLLLKFFAAGLAAANLALLMRTVQLLPWNPRWHNASRLARALPGLTACTVCGLEFSFWQEATSTCGDLLDLLLLAAAVWLLLEYNIRRQASWLDAATVVWGLGMAENWVMLLTLPLFVAVVVWLHRTSFFSLKFILRLAGLGLAGFSVYVLPPMANGLLPSSLWTLGQAWMASLHQTKSDLSLPHAVWRANRFVAISAAICFLVPTLPLLVRMRDKGMRHESIAGRIQLGLTRSLRLGLLLACCWLAFDPNSGARQMVRQLGDRTPMLTFDYVNALGAAFLLGNFLLISRSVVRDSRRSRDKNPWRLSVSVATASLALLAAGLAVRNAPAIWRTNHHPLEQFGELAVKSLPAARGVVLSDFPDRLMIFQAALARGHGAAEWLAVETRALPSVQYRARLEQRLPAGWLTDQTRHELTLDETRRLLEQVARSNRLFYLHPSYGQFFEGFYLEPTGMIFEMKLRGKNPLDLPALSGTTLAANEQFWTRLWDQELASTISASTGSSWWSAKLARFSLSPAPRDQDRLLRHWYSISLGTWAVALQKQGRMGEAHARFEQALQLDTNNLAARLSLACNTNLQAGIPVGLSDLRQVTSQLGRSDWLEAIMNSGGPIDEPSACYLVGSRYFDRGLLVQAAEQMERARTLAPVSPAPELALAELYNRLQMPERSRPLINHLREEFRNAPANNSLDLDLAWQDSYSWQLQNKPANARDTLQSLMRQHPGDPQIAASRVLLGFLDLNDVTNALQLVEERLAKSPDDVPSLYAKAMILMQSGRAAAALVVLDHVLTLTNLPVVRVKRAFVLIATQNFIQARSELNALQNSGTEAGWVDFGLALVAGHDYDTNSARHYLQLCLSNTPTGTPLWVQANASLRRLEPAK